MNMDGHAFAAWSAGPGEPWRTELVPLRPGSGRWKDRVEISPVFFDGEPFHVVVHGGRDRDLGAFLAPSPAAPGDPPKRTARLPLVRELGDPPAACGAEAAPPGSPSRRTARRACAASRRWRSPGPKVAPASGTRTSTSARAVASMSCACAPGAFPVTDPRWPYFVGAWL